MNEPPNERNDWPLLDLLRRFEVTPKNNQRAVAGVPTHPEENEPMTLLGLAAVKWMSVC